MSRQKLQSPGEAAAARSDESAGATGACAVCGAMLSGARCGACGAAVRPGDYTVQRLIARTPHSRVYLAQGPGGLDLSHLEAPALGSWLRKLTALRPEDRYRSAKLAREAVEALQPSITPARAEQASSVVLSADAPAALARFAQEAQAAREASAKAQRRQQQEREKEERGEVL